MTVAIGRFVARGGWLFALVVAVVASGCSSTPVTCPTGQTSCGGVCVDLTSNPLYCGACNVACDVGASCSGGVCTCPADRPATCGLLCVNKQTDPANCGTCGHACGLGSCAAGGCVCNAPSPPISLCPNDPATGTCLDTSSSASHCGGCNVVCPAGEVCTQSNCVCNPPNEICVEGATTVCTNLASDPKHCGSCTTSCAAGQVCASGTCQQACAAGFTLCGTTCVNLQTDPANCGTCGRACALGQSCSAGTCQASCSTLSCGGACCQAPLGNTCCGTACPYQHRNFVGTPSEHAYYNCAAPFVWDLGTAQTAARAWAPGGNQITPTQSCPTVGGSLCLVWQKPILASDVGCAVFCYSGAFEGAATVTTSYACPCPVQQRIDWY
jgi:hypothetical protein